ncbi:bifunctional non-homologous end joining protein LigD [Jatrophihabitans sp. GAS493]|nr:bifunctional non-homologous end joining protein LigD [Jatrophihabitans sp. GAS493]
MLATARSDLPRGPGWLYEFKWDGIRALVDVHDGTARITTRNGNDVTIAYPELQTLGTDFSDALLDGEIVAFNNGRPSFESLQQRMNVQQAAPARALAAENPVAFIAFDLLRLYGVDLTGRELHERRETLQRLADGSIDGGTADGGSADGGSAASAAWSLSPAFDDPDAVSSAAHAHELEGVVAKRGDSRYHPGARSADWVKVKFIQRSEFVVIGWESAGDSASRLSSLVLGYFADGRLRVAGKVGSGLTNATARALQGQLVTDPRPAELGLKASPGRVLTRVQPRTVVEVSYSQWSNDTDQARLRHPVFVGVRTDKDASEVGRD